MTRTIHVVALSAALMIGVSGGAWAQAKRDGHPLLDRAMLQISNIRTRLQGAPKDFGGHKQKAIDALSLANDELRQALQFDK